MTDTAWEQELHGIVGLDETAWLEVAVITDGLDEQVPFLVVDEGGDTVEQQLRAIVEREQADRLQGLELLVARHREQEDAIREAWRARWDRLLSSLLRRWTPRRPRGDR